MDHTSGSTQPIWLDCDLKNLQRPSLASHQNADICIIGAGIAGLSVAYHLSQSGMQVIVLDDGAIASGESGRTTAHLSNAIDDRYYKLERVMGAHAARMAAASHSRAIDRIEEIVSEETIDCDFLRLDGFLFEPPSGDDSNLQKELEAAHRAGLVGVDLLQRAPIDGCEIGPVLHFPRQGQFHPVKYLAGLSAAIERRGGKIFCGTHAVALCGGNTGCVETTAGFKVHCKAIVIATNTPVFNRVSLHTKQMAYRSYAVAIEVPTGTMPPALFWDNDDPYHYVRLQPSHPTDFLIVGGEDHKTGEPDEADRRFNALHTWARHRWTQLGSIAYRWSGQIMETDDLLAFIGRNPGDEENVYVVTGDSGMGMTHGTIAGMLIDDLIVGRQNPWAEVYDPSRITLAAAKDYLVENFDTAAKYKGWLTPGDKPATDIKPGDGAIVREGLNKIAIYREPTGALHRMSAVCPHLGAIVTWNTTEKTWDCPAHGSRFDCFGTPLNGPANVGLKPVQDDRKRAA